MAYACLSTTLLLTVLVSILATRFADINRDAIEEYMFRRAVVVFEGTLAGFNSSITENLNFRCVQVLNQMRYLTIGHQSTYLR